MKILFESKIFDGKSFKNFLLVENGKVVSLDNEKFKVFDKHIVLTNKYIYPSFFDSHTHMIWYGLNLLRCNLTGVKSVEEIIYRIKKYLKDNKDSKFVITEGYDETKFLKKEKLNKKILDQHFKNVPVIVRRVCGHIAVFNSEAIEYLKKSEKFEDFSDDGVLKEGIVLKLNTIFKPDKKELFKAFKIAQEKFLSFGITSVSDMATFDSLDVYSEVDSVLDIFFYFPWENEKKLSEWKDKDRIKLKGLKIFTDGSIGAFTAAVYKNYKNGQRGKIFISEKDFKQIVLIAKEKNYQLAIHSIGDRATDFVLKNLSDPEGHRIEHFEISSKEQIEKVKEKGIFLSMQPNFIGNWGLKGQMYEERLNKNYFEFNNVFRYIFNKKIPLGFGSDCMPPSPLYGLNSLKKALFEEQRIDFIDGFKCYTEGGARIVHEEKKLGKLLKGFKADFIVTDKRINEDDVKIVETYKEGNLVFKSKKERI
ncbi:MAG: amidohydrolase [candidate division WOR-3 bacterium]